MKKINKARMLMPGTVYSIDITYPTEREHGNKKVLIEVFSGHWNNRKHLFSKKVDNKQSIVQIQKDVWTEIRKVEANFEQGRKVKPSTPVLN